MAGGAAVGAGAGLTPGADNGERGTLGVVGVPGLADGGDKGALGAVGAGGLGGLDGSETERAPRVAWAGPLFDDVPRVRGISGTLGMGFPPLADPILGGLLSVGFS